MAKSAGSRLPYLQRDDLDEAGLAVWDNLLSTRGPSIVNNIGGLVGPFNALIHAPRVGAAVTRLGTVLRFETSLDRRLRELAIVVVAARWKAEFEWWAHAQLAGKHGIDPAVINAIRRGETPSFAADDESAVYRFACQLAVNGAVDTETFETAVQQFGYESIVELVMLCGYYAMISYTLNAFSVPPPDGVSPSLA